MNSIVDPLPNQSQCNRRPGTGLCRSARPSRFASTAFLGCCLAVGALSLAGCSEPTAAESLVGKWKGSPPTQEDAGQFVDQATAGSDVPALAQNPLIKGIAKTALSSLGAAQLAVTVEFKPTGTAFYSGNTAAIGVEPEADGSWQVLEDQGDILKVKMGSAEHPFEARLTLRDDDTFVLRRMDAAGKDIPPIVFKRVTY
jgi:hypothetical protein